ncbi:hypothetical protein [Micromonospora aurantiaca (nom. illeg.)]|uniref:hypothetical protein n=1 Tax=Micromonospora aurantiaca (nom. illeg.) TaxID=47850 RepID=UPI001645B18C|nr:hypothetical protein [Micromonospora aurantiaca]MBC9000457.1 hypothetical protein [Micromonospora aurantiaca]
MAHTVLVGRCRRCRAGLSGCCRPRLRTARRHQRPRRCGPCRGVARFGSESIAVQVAASIAAATGAAPTVRPCPLGHGFHITFPQGASREQ